MSLQITTSAAGKPTLIGTAPDGRQIHIHSAYDPEIEAAEWASKPSLRNASTIIVCGFGLGYHIRALLERVRKHCIILVVEKHLEFAQKWLDENPLPETDTRKVVLIDNELLRGTITALGHYMSARSGIEFVEHLPSVQMDPEYYAQTLRKAVEAMRGVKVQVNTYIHLGPYFLTNVFRNAPAVLKDPGVKKLKNILKGKPAILAAAGPSLKKHMETLRVLKGKVPIFAAGSTYQALVRHGIYPDGVASVDPHPSVNYELYQGLAHEDVSLFYDIMTTPEVVDEFTGPRFAYHTSSSVVAAEVIKRTGIIGRLAPGGTVAAPLFSLMHWMGANPIILVGQDFALTNNASHVEGVTGAETDIPPESHSIWVDDWAGTGKVPTNNVLFLFLRSLERLYKAASEAGITVIDATEGGAAKQDTVRMTLREALDTYCKEPCDVRPLLRARYERHKPSVKAARRLTAYFRRVEARARRLRALLIESEETLHELDRIIEAIQKPENAVFRPSLIRRGDALHERAAKENAEILKYQDIINLIDMSLPFVNLGPRADEETLSTIVDTTRLSYREILVTLGYLLQVLEPVNQRFAEQQAPVVQS